MRGGFWMGALVGAGGLYALMKFGIVPRPTVRSMRAGR